MKIGDVVQLKSGGPKMTINYVNDNGGRINCIWFHQGEVKTEEFLCSCLQKAKKG